MDRVRRRHITAAATESVVTAVNVDPERASRAAAALQAGTVEVQRDGRRSFTVSSFTGEEAYRVTLGPPTCECPDAAYRGSICKHQLAALMAAGLNGRAT